MWKNQLTTALRNFKRNVFYSLNNVLGLAIALTAFAYITIYVNHEYSIDTRVPDGEHTFRLTMDKYRNGEQILTGAETYVGCGPAIAGEIPEILSYTRTHNTAIRMNGVISYTSSGGDVQAHKLKDFYYADEEFTNFFGYELQKGNPEKALSEPYTAVITASTAELYFGEEDPMGKILRYQDESGVDDEYRITGVVEDPEKTHLPFSILFSYATLHQYPSAERYTTSWRARKSYTYFKLHSASSPQEVELKLNEVAQTHFNLAENIREEFHLQPLKEIHFTSGLEGEPTPTVNRQILNFLSVLSYFILIIAFVNYVNLATSHLMTRTHLIGVKKILGASSYSLLLQQYLECALLTIAAFISSAALLFFSFSFFNSLAGVDIPYAAITSTSFILEIVISSTLGVLFFGFIPALIATTIDPVKAMLGRFNWKSSYMRIALTTGQFALSFALITATIIVYQQSKFMMKQKLGFEIQNRLVVRSPGVMPTEELAELDNTYNAFLREVGQLSAVNGYAASLTIPGHQKAFRTGTSLVNDPEAVTTFRFNGVGPEFMDTYGLNILKGRNFKFNQSYDIDSTIIISESAVAALGFSSIDEAIGQRIQVPAFGLNSEIIGVVNDYRLESVKKELEPTAFIYYEPVFTNFLTFSIEPGASLNLDKVAAIWQKHFPGNPIDYFFLEDYFNKQYDRETSLFNLLSIFAILVIALAIFGLVGLSIFLLKRKQKEVAVRKTLGSSVASIYSKLIVSYLRLILLAVLLGTPMAYYFGVKWLQNFPIQISLSPEYFLIPAVLLALAAVTSVSVQVWRVANINPANILRAE